MSFKGCGGSLEVQLLSELATPAEMMAGYKPSMPPQQLQVFRGMYLCVCVGGGYLGCTETLAVGLGTVLLGAGVALGVVGGSNVFFEFKTPAEMMAGYKPSMPPQQLQVR